MPKDQPIDDFDPPLSERGRADAPGTGRWLAGSAFEPDLVLCSPARRTRQTWQLAAAALKNPPPVVYDERLYNAAPSMLPTMLAEGGSGLRSLALVGHNPGIHELAVGLAGSGPSDLSERVRAGFPTSGVVVMDVLGGWEDAGQRDGGCLLVSSRLTPVGPVRPSVGTDSPRPAGAPAA
ncbi:histidine phosphatase family protein [Streptomyces sp. NBC_00160]|uniref:SixA phosphatase family protein n=1 Tax=Streptomyces sp. NBC_00160 TaxID=2903628 RepID=UPI00224E6DFB|nr:histidine phosphatase family protein [Streptomyces sp. NBC_00160]MCX5309103.1 histidine phosphatase family protein [Streptomyces sp. NBC_00160]